MSESATIEQLRIQYSDSHGTADRLRQAVVAQLNALMTNNNLTLGVPIESRVKDWASIEDKLERKVKQLSHVTELNDLIGVRIIFLFPSDLEAAVEKIATHFNVIDSENTGDRLSASEFGYQSTHVTLSLPEAWLSVPSLAGLGNFSVELQLRTLAQHRWAAASHKLQYKSTASVPAPLRRSIHRVSALLETVDLEFSRLLEQRNSYKEAGIGQQEEPLNVDTLEAVLDEVLPAANKREDEKYAGLLADLQRADLSTPRKLREFLLATLTATLEVEANSVSKGRDPNDLYSLMSDRIDQGVFYAHAGLVRTALRIHFGDDMANKIIQIDPREFETPSKNVD